MAKNHRLHIFLRKKPCLRKKLRFCLQLVYTPVRIFVWEIFYDNDGTGNPRKGGVRYDDNKGTKNFYAESLCDPDTGNGSTF